MTANDFNDYFPTWCPGCGDYGIWASLKEALVKLGLEADQFVIVFGIGCSGNMNEFIKCYGSITSLHFTKYTFRRICMRIKHKKQIKDRKYYNYKS